ncbi:MAG: hypothetical protein LBJ57_03240 [Prevotellaceae bacterium]|jgi:hypothetical protein|nr:hypothetical protein [Prevotellaceae bacterium]
MLLAPAILSAIGRVVVVEIIREPALLPAREGLKHSSSAKILRELQKK